MTTGRFRRGGLAANGILLPGQGSIHTRNYPYPSGEIIVGASSPNERYVTHHGQIRPNSTVIFST